MNLQKAHSEICKIFTVLVFQNGRLETEKAQLKNKILPQTEIIKNGGSKPNTYAKIVSASLKENESVEPFERDLEHGENEKWATPKTTKKHEMIIRVGNAKDAKDALKKFKNEIQNTDGGKGFKSVRKTKNGAIIVESFDKNQQNKLKLAVQGKEDIKIKESEISNPMFMITGIEKGLSNEEFLEEIERMNNEVVGELGYTVSDKIQVIAKNSAAIQGRRIGFFRHHPRSPSGF